MACDWLATDLDIVQCRIDTLVAWYHGLSERLGEGTLKSLGDCFLHAQALGRIAESDVPTPLEALQGLRRTLLPLGRAVSEAFPGDGAAKPRSRQWLDKTVKDVAECWPRKSGFRRPVTT